MILLNNFLTRGERFKDARTVHNKNGKQTYEEVEAATGVTKSMINDLENDEKDRRVGYQFISTLAAHYGVSTDWLMGNSDFMSPNIDIQGACKLTGLSDAGFTSLMRLKYDGNIIVLDALLKSDYFKEFLDSLQHLDTQVTQYLLKIIALAETTFPPDDKIAHDFCVENLEDLETNLGFSIYEFQQSAEIMADELFEIKKHSNNLKLLCTATKYIKNVEGFSEGGFTKLLNKYGITFEFPKEK